MTGPLLEVAGLSKTFVQGARLNPLQPAREVRAVDGISFAIDRGETLALVGESGCGKSTTGRLILRLIEPSAGTVRFRGEDLRALDPARMRRLRGQMQIIFQDPYGSLSPRRTVAQIIAEPLDAHNAVRGRRERHERIADLLTRVGLSPRDMTRYPRQFSGGQRQRIGIARAIALGPSFIVADEPVSALDVSVQAQIINLLEEIQEERQMAYLFISHNLAIVRHIADRVAVMYLGRIVEIGPKRSVFVAPHHPYTQALLSAAPEPSPVTRQKRIILQGDVPSPYAVPSGCGFRTRCPLARPVCAEQRPDLTEVSPGQFAACHFARPNPIRVDSREP